MLMPIGVRVFLVTGPVDLRGSFYSLSAHVRGVLQQDPQQGHLFVFLGKTGTLIKILFWDRSGYCIFAKRLERVDSSFRRTCPKTLSDTRSTSPPSRCCSRASTWSAPNADPPTQSPCSGRTGQNRTVE